MTKFDHSSNKPEVLKAHEMSILPESRYGYILCKFKLYEKLMYVKNVACINDDVSNLESIKRENLTSEAISLHSADITGILNDFTGK